LYASQQAPNFVNRLQNIAIVGASGTIGSKIVSALLAKNTFTITAITRADSKATFDPSIKIARVDYTNPSTLVTALQGQDCLIITLSVSAARDTQSKLIHAAASAHIPWILPNEFGMYNTEAAQLDTVGPSKTADRNLIASLGLAWIGLTCGFWYEHSLSGPQLFGFDISKRNVVFFDDGRQKLNTSTYAQTGRAVGEILSLPILPYDENDASLTLSSYRDRMVFVSSFAVSQRDMFESVKRVTGTVEGEWSVEVEAARERFAGAREEVRKGNYAAFGKCLYSRYFFDDEGLFEKSHGLDNGRLGLEEEDLDEATGRAVELVESGYWSTYGRR
jgi:NAD(P)-dependent dehydrogenase (short-subunit alcohol dehydrogenase family)